MLAIDKTAFADHSRLMIETFDNPAAALARMRTGIKERPSKRKRAAALVNLSKARRVWQNLAPEDRKHRLVNPAN